MIGTEQRRKLRVIGPARRRLEFLVEQWICGAGWHPVLDWSHDSEEKALERAEQEARGGKEIRVRATFGVIASTLKDFDNA